MENYKLFPAEYRMMDIFWDNQPITTPELARLCKEKYGWNKNTTFTQIKRMVDRGFIRKENTMLYVIVTRNMVERYDSSEVVNSRFAGSFPKFVAAFFDGNKISRKEFEEIKKIFDEYDGE